MSAFEVLLGICPYILLAGTAAAAPEPIHLVTNLEDNLEETLARAVEAKAARAVVATPEKVVPYLSVQNSSDERVVLEARLPNESARRRVLSPRAPTSEQWVQIVALAGAELLESEALELLELMTRACERTSRPPRRTAPPAPELPRVPEASQPSVPQHSTPRLMSIPGRTATLRAEPTTELEEPAPRPRNHLDLVPLGLDFIPYLGMSSIWKGGDRRVLSIGALGGWTGALEGVAVSGVVDLVETHVRGMEIGGVVALAHGSVEGLQLGGISASAGGYLDGLQLGGISARAERVRGLQIGGISSYAAGGLEGVQLGLVNHAGEGAGLQAGLVQHVDGDFDGIQVGLVNVVGGKAGVQIGLVNVSESAQASIGLVNAQRDAPLTMRAGVDSDGFLRAAFRHGGGLIHGWIDGGYSLVDPMVVRAGMGWGISPYDDETLRVDADALAHALWYLRAPEGSEDGSVPDLVTELRISASYAVLDQLSLYANLGAQLQISWRERAMPLAPLGRVALADEEQLFLAPALGVGASITL